MLTYSPRCRAFCFGSGLAHDRLCTSIFAQRQTPDSQLSSWGWRSRSPGQHWLFGRAVTICATTEMAQAKGIESVEPVPENADFEEEEGKTSDVYSATMQQAMGGTLEYRHENGMNYNTVLENIIVGSCLQTADDVDRLVNEEGVGAILCLQEDSDMDWFHLDVKPIIRRCHERGDIHHIRHRIRDFDPFDLRIRLPGAVQQVADQAAQGRKVYIHCTAGMGRAPATALAYMVWCRGWSLADAHAHLTSVRACNPRLVAIRQAACDLLLDGGGRTRVTLGVSRTGLAQRVQIAGLDVGWGQRIDLTRDAQTQRFVTERSLPAGKFPYKLVFDEHLWTCSADHPVMQDGDHVNNFVEVAGNASSEAIEARARIMSEAGNFTAQERQQLEQMFADHKFSDPA